MTDLLTCLYRTAMVLATTSVLSAWAHECYVCSGNFPERDCELWPSTVPHGPGKQECGSRYCTTMTRYRAMKHLLIPLGPNKPAATAAPLRPADFEARSIIRDCVERVDTARQNKCFPDADGLGATCFTACTTALCNGGLRKPNTDELHIKGDRQTLPPAGPNEFDRWSPSPTYRPTTPAPRTSTDIHVLETKTGTPDYDLDPERGPGGRGDGGRGGRKFRLRPGGSKRGEKANIRGMAEDAEGHSGAQRACVSALVAACGMVVYSLM